MRIINPLAPEEGIIEDVLESKWHFVGWIKGRARYLASDGWELVNEAERDITKDLMPDDNNPQDLNIHGKIMRLERGYRWNKDQAILIPEDIDTQVADYLTEQKVRFVEPLEFITWLTDSFQKDFLRVFRG